MTGELVTKELSTQQIALVRSIAAPKCTEDEFQLLLYQAKTYGLDPLLKQIWAVKYQEGRPASIFAGRDGFLAIAHRSGAFNGMESGTRTEADGNVIGWAKVYRKDMDHPFCVEVSMKEYNRKQGTWLTHPATMIQKVAEAQALRRAFQISGIYSPDEMPEPLEKPAMKDITPEPEKKKGGRVPVHDLSKESKIIDAEAEQRK